MTEQVNCAICNQALPDPDFARNYPNLVCRACDARALNAAGEPASFESMHDYDDNPVFIDGNKCWRRYRFGGHITMRDEFDCADLGEFYDRFSGHLRAGN